jgi:hypothetical protein
MDNAVTSRGRLFDRIVETKLLVVLEENALQLLGDSDKIARKIWLNIIEEPREVLLCLCFSAIVDVCIGTVIMI